MSIQGRAYRIIIDDPIPTGKFILVYRERVFFSSSLYGMSLKNNIFNAIKSLHLDVIDFDSLLKVVRNHIQFVKNLEIYTEDRFYNGPNFVDFHDAYQERFGADYLFIKNLSGHTIDCEDRKDRSFSIKNGETICLHLGCIIDNLEDSARIVLALSERTNNDTREIHTDM